MPSEPHFLSSSSRTEEISQTVGRRGVFSTSAGVVLSGKSRSHLVIISFTGAACIVSQARCMVYTNRDYCVTRWEGGCASVSFSPLVRLTLADVFVAGSIGVLVRFSKGRRRKIRYGIHSRF